MGLLTQMCNLNNDIFNRDSRTDPTCRCGYSKERAEHYLLLCPNYNNIRASTIHTLRSNQTDIRTLLYGNLELRYLENEHIFITVQIFIKKSKRLQAQTGKDMRFANRLIPSVTYIITDQAGLYADINIREHM